ncbi:MAG: superoxide dismutase [Patescibacteria group bacterium]
MIGISEKTMAIHRDKLYAGYVKKSEEIGNKLGELRKSGKAEGNATFSELRALKTEETFATNGVYLHEWYFENISGEGKTEDAPELAKALEEKFGSFEDGVKYMSECGMAARGWAILAWDTKKAKLMQYNADSHNQGGVWGCIPIIVLDVYEHAYFIDFGSDRKAYIEAFWKNFDWKAAEELYLKVRDIVL